jgi:hypothetical protein
MQIRTVKSNYRALFSIFAPSYFRIKKFTLHVPIPQSVIRDPQSLAQTCFMKLVYISSNLFFLPFGANKLRPSRSPRRRLRARFQPIGFIGLQAGGRIDSRGIVQLSVERRRVPIPHSVFCPLLSAFSFQVFFPLPPSAFPIPYSVFCPLL